MKTFKFKINDKNYDADIVSVEENILTLHLNGTEYKVELDESVQPTKPVVKKVAPASSAASTAPTTPTTSSAGVPLKSPLPGTILDLFVKVGDTVEKDQKVILLEAMKMENNIEADKAGIVKEINVSKGDAVMEGDVLLVIG